MAKSPIDQSQTFKAIFHQGFAIQSINISFAEINHFSFNFIKKPNEALNGIETNQNISSIVSNSPCLLWAFSKTSSYFHLKFISLENSSNHSSKASSSFCLSIFLPNLFSKNNHIFHLKISRKLFIFSSGKSVKLFFISSILFCKLSTIPSTFKLSILEIRFFKSFQTNQPTTVSQTVPISQSLNLETDFLCTCLSIK